MTSRRGPLVAIEGIDGAGTTTQAKELVAQLHKRGIDAHLTCEPSTGPIGQLIRQTLRGQTKVPAGALALLFAADRLDHVRREIEPQLAKGTVVVSDRYLFSSLAYQSIDNDLQWVELINGLAPLPDLTLFIRVDADVALGRVAQRGQELEIFENRSLQVAIAQRYDQLLGSDAAAPGSNATTPLGPLGGGDPGFVFHSKCLPISIPCRIQEDPAVDPPLLAVIDGCLPLDSVQKSVQDAYEEFASRRGIWDAA